MAVMYDDQGDLDKAISEYKQVLQQDAKSLLVRVNLAAAYIKKKEWGRAAAELQAAIKLDPEAVEPHAILALLYSSQNKIDLANREYESALKNASALSPKNVDIYKTLGAIYLQQKRFDDAKKTYELVIKLSPSDPEAYFFAATTCDELHQRPEARRYLRKAISLKPDYSSALNYLGYMYVEDGQNLPEAEGLIKQALDLEPDNGAYVDSLGWYYFRVGKIQAAIKELERARLLLDDPEVYEHLGTAYLKSGDKASARKNWRRSLELDPGQEQLKKKLHDLE